MRICASVLTLASALFGAVPAAAATNFTVIVGQGGLVFTPAQLPPAGMAVHPGDTITFTNFTDATHSPGFHNAHSTDPNFSFECGKGNSCTTGVADPSAWSATVTVPDGAAGHTITYSCDVHVDLGMVGTIAVTAATTPVELQSFDVD